MNIQFTLARRYLSGRKLRTFLTTLAIVFGVLVIFSMNTILPSFVQAFQANTLAAAGQVDASISLKTGDAFDAGALDKVAAVEGVKAVSGMLERTVNLPADYYDGDPATPDAISALALVGINVDQASQLHSYVADEGRFLQDGDAGAVISRSLADAIGVRLGDDLRLPTTAGEASLPIVGVLPARAMPGNEEVLVNLPQAQAMLDMPGKINEIEANFDTLDEGRRAEIESTLLASLGSAYQVGTLAFNSEILTNIKTGQAVFNLLGVLALLMGAFIIFNTSRTVVAERRRDIGMLRALGARRSTIFGVITFEGLIQGIVGTTVGLAIGYLLAVLMLRLMGPLMQQFMNVRLGAPTVSPALVIGSIVIGIGITLLAGVIPAFNATKVTPLEALRPSVGAVSFRRLAGIGFWAGITLIVLAIGLLLTKNVSYVGLGGMLFVIGLILAAPGLVNPIARFFAALLAMIFAKGGTGQLAEGNLSRQPGRAAITASTTMIGMAILIMAAATISSVYIGFGEVMRRSLGSDYILIPPSIAIWGSNLGASEQLRDDLGSIDGVGVVSTLRFAPTEANGLAASLLGIDPATYPQVSGLTFSKGDESAYTALNEGRNVILNPVTAANVGAKVGDEVTFLTPEGEQPYRVVAIAGDYLNAKIATAYISQANIAADFGRQEDVLYQMNLSPGADAAAVEQSIKDTVKGYPQFRLIVGREYIEQNMRLLDTAFLSMYVLVLFLAIPSLIAMINTLAIGVIERTREIGMLRAVGATRTQVRRIIVSEALILSALGTVLGVLSGLYLGYMAVLALTSAGFPVKWVFPTQGVVIAILAGIIFGVLAAIIPSRQASRLEIVQALRYE